MAIAGLILGILGLVAFSWGGPALGALIAGGSTIQSTLAGQMQFTATPIWVTGLIVGVGFPLVAVGLSIAAMVKTDNRGAAIAGLVLGVLGAIIGLVVTYLIASGVNMAKKLTETDNSAALQALPDFNDMQQQLNDPAFQKQIQDAMKRASDMQRVPADDTPPPAPPSPSIPPPAPGVAPAPAPLPSTLPAEALPPSAPSAPATPPSAPAP